jgi:hypothetical protein
MRKSIVLTAAALFAAAAACTIPAVAKPKVSEIPVTKTTDKASPKLFRSNTGLVTQRPAKRVEKGSMLAEHRRASHHCVD